MLAPTIRSLRNTLLVGATALVLVGAYAPIAQAELSSGSLTELATKARQEEETAASTTATVPANEKREAESALPGPLVLFGVGAAVVLLLGIAFVIVRDARSAAPVTEGALSSGGGRNAEVRLRKRRAKAKAARQQRKRNR